MLIRPMTVEEHDEMLDNRWTCARCPEMATHRVVGGGNFRLCDRHAAETAQRMAVTVDA